jgi:hypothetical protein
MQMLSQCTVASQQPCYKLTVFPDPDQEVLRQFSQTLEAGPDIVVGQSNAR